MIHASVTVMEYLTLVDIAKRLGVAQSSATAMRLPFPDARIGDRKVWEPATVEAIVEARNTGRRLELNPHHIPTQYYTRYEVADILDIPRGSIKRVELPEPDATAGRYRGWLPETIAAWAESR